MFNPIDSNFEKYFVYLAKILIDNSVGPRSERSDRGPKASVRSGPGPWTAGPFNFGPV